MIISGHLDVVPADDDKFFLKEEDDKLFGRGVYDMKAEVVASLYAIKSFIKSKKNLKIAVVLTSDEEIDGAGTKYLLNEINYKSKFAIVPDGGSIDKICNQQKGFWQFSLSVFGKNAHASNPWEGVNAIEKSMSLIQVIKDKFSDPDKVSEWQTSVVVTKIESGEALNQVPSEAVLNLSLIHI